jgi:hypothetical protein
MRKLSALLLSSVLALSFIASASASTAPQKEWTMLVYLNGDNNLDSFGATNIEQMEKEGSTDQVNVVVQWASEGAGKTQRLLVQKSTNPNAVTSPILQDMGKVDMGSYKSLIDFITWGVQNYPAKHYFIDVWDHGSGWHALKAMSSSMSSVRGSFHPTDISWDDNSGNSITTEQLGQAMAAAAQIIGHKVDLYGSDACLMAMAEVANEMSDSVDTFVGSQETEPGAGWPYAELLQGWNSYSAATPQQVAKVLVDAYVKSYQNGSNGSSEVTFSAFDLNQMAQLDNAVSVFAKKVRTLDAASKAKLLAAAQKTQNFVDADYGDLGDFITNIQAARLSSPEVDDLKVAVEQFIIANADTTQYARAKGLSIWLPTDASTYSSNSARYQGMKFDKATDWGSSLAYLLQ